MKVFRDITSLIGNTPLIEIHRHEKENALILGKWEAANPAGSAKDRVALALITDAEKRGILKSDSVIIEPTSGNTGIGLAAVAVARGYRVILTMPETMSAERRALLKAYGAELVLTDGSRGMTGAVEKAKELAASIPNSFIPDQFSNVAGARAHFETTGPEIWRDTDGRVDIFVAGVGTGGTITGVGEYLKSQNSAVQVVAVEPSRSPLLSGGKAAAHGLQGIGANFVPALLNTDIYDEVVTVSEEEAYRAARELMNTQGFSVGISSGAALHAARMLARRAENKGKTIVVLLPDTGDRYLSTPLFTE